MEKSIVLSIPLGYSVVEKRKTVDLGKAEKILTTKRQRYYTEAIWGEVDVELISNHIICPYCNGRFAANNKFSPFCNRWKLQGKRVPRHIIHELSDKQLSFFEDERAKRLRISSPIRETKAFECPACGKISKFSENFRCVEISMNEEIIKIKSEILTLEEVFAQDWNDSKRVSVTFPMYETVVFDLGKGRIYAEMENEDGDGEKIAGKEITNHPEMLVDGAVYNAVCLNKIVNRTVKRMFSEVWGSMLPYNGDDITIPNLFKMTMFIGYDKAFYSCIPYKVNSFAIDDSFKEVAENLHNIKNVERIYKNSSLPNAKSVKRIFFESLELFFYLKEAEMVFSAINDLNIYCRFLKSRYVFEVLADLHLRPGLIEYIKDYAFAKGQSGLMKTIEGSWSEVRDAAIDYCCIREDAKKTVRESWKDKGIARSVRGKSLHSIPTNRPIKEIPDCCIDGYKFTWLRSSNEYAIAGKMLRNCLGEWGADNFPVVCVKKQNRYVAAIEVSERGVVQAHGRENTDFRWDKKLNSAFEKWMKCYNLCWDHISYDFDDDYEE